MKNLSRSARIPASRLRPSPLALALASASMLSLVPGLDGARAQALPIGPAVVNGRAGIVVNGNHMTVTNSANAVLNWQSFSIGNGNSVRFEQPNAASQVLNRVIGTDPSSILGNLSSNGRVWLLNPNGILFGQNARVDVAGLVASTLNISNSDWLNGRYNFVESSIGGASVVNDGELRTSLGGRIALVAGSGGVRNTGVIDAQGGQVILAAGQSVDLIDTGAPNLTLRVAAPAGEALNLGRISASSGRVDVQAAIVNQQGIVRADAFSRGAGGQIAISATESLTLTAGSSTTARGDSGGQITLDSGAGTLLSSSADVAATGSTARGGQIKLLGQQIGLLDGARVDASGATGGGDMNVGGGRQGQDAAIPNARAVFIASTASLAANATTTGHGGNIVVWSNEATRAHGAFSVRGGPLGGDGGFVETSGGWLDTREVRVDTGASAAGKAGLWLIDPNNIDIVNTAPTGGGVPATQTGGVFTTPNDNTYVLASTIRSALNAGGNVSITTGTAGTNAQAGNITGNGVDLAPSVFGFPTATLTLTAHGNISLSNATIAPSGSGTMNLVLTAGTGGTGSVDLTNTRISIDGTVRINTPAMNIGLTTSITSNAGGDAMIIKGVGATNLTTFVNNARISPFITTGGRWLLYTTNIGGTTLGTLTYGFKQYNAAQGTGLPTPLDTRSGILYSIAPTLTFATNPTKVYDGTTAITFSGSIGVNGLVSGDTIVFDTPNGNFVDKNAGTAKAITLGTDAFETTDSTNHAVYGYRFNALGDITQRQLTIDTITGNNKVYDGTTAASVNVSGLRNLAGSEAFTSVVTAALFDTKDAGTGKSVAVGYTIGGGINGALLANYDLTQLPRTTTASITPRSLNPGVSGAVTKVYDGTTTAVLLTNPTGLVSGEGFATYATGTFDTKDAGVNKTVFPSGALGAPLNAASLASNYVVPSELSPVSGTIAPKPLTLTGATAANKVYDGNTTATTSGGTLAGLVGSEAFTFTSTGTFDTKDVGSGKTVTVNPTLGTGSNGALAANYTTSGGTTTAAITPKALNLAGATAQNKVYDGNTSATVTGGTLAGLVGSESFATITASGSFADKDAGTGKIVFTTFTVGGGSNGALTGNYTTAGGQTTANITPKALTLAGAVANDKVYDGSTAASFTGGNLIGLVGTESFGFTTTGNFDTKDVGTGKAVTYTGTLGTPSGGALAANYVLPTGSSGTSTANITPKPLTVTGLTAADKVYDGTVAASVSGGQLVGLVAGESLATGGATGSFDTKDAGTDKVVTVNLTLANGSGGALASNYLLASVPTTTASITPKALTLAGVSALDKVYDGTTAAVLTPGTLTGLVGTESFASTAVGNFSDKDAGTGKTVVIVNSLGAGSNGALAGNYTLAGSSTTTASITPKVLSYGTATAADKVYDGNRQATMTNAGLIGLVGTETFATSTTGTFDTKDAGTGKTVSYASTIGAGSNGAVATNYGTPTAATGTTTASITPKALTLTGLTAADKVYDGNTGAVITGGTLNGLVGSESFATSGIAASFDTKDAGVDKGVFVNFALTNGTNGALASNYSVGTTASTTASITPKALTLSGVTAQNKVYDGNTAAVLTPGTLTGLVGTESFASTAVGNFSSKDAGTGKTVVIVNSLGAGSNGALASNYTLAGSSTTTADITPKALSFGTVTAADKVYDGTRTASFTGGGLQGLVGTETFGTTIAGSFDTKDAATGKTVTYTQALGTGSNGALAANYMVPTGASGTTTASITPKALTLTGAIAQDKVYDGSTVAAVSGGSVNGLVGNESFGAAGITGRFDTKDAGTNKGVIVDFSLTAGTNGALASNYSVGTVASTTASITPKALTLTGVTAQNKVYDGNTAAVLTPGTLTGLVGTESFASTAVGNFSSKDAGTGKTVVIVNSLGAGSNGALASNYTLAGSSTTTADITPKALSFGTVTAADKVYDGTRTANFTGGGLQGLVGTETFGTTIAGSFDTKDAATGKTVTYTQALGTGSNGALAANYVLPAGGSGTTTASITPKALTLTGVTAADKVYDGSTAAVTTGGTLNGMVGTENFATSGVAATFDTKDAGTNKGVIVNFALSNGTNGALASNYSVGTTASTTASITPKALSITGVTALDKVYDGTRVASLTGGTLVGLVGSENFATAGTGSFDTKDVGASKVVIVNYALGDGVNGARAANYTLAGGTTATAAITPRALSLVGVTAADKVYDGTTAVTSSGGTLAGLVQGETFATTTAGRFADKNAGTAKTVTVTLAVGAGSNGAVASNYVLPPSTATTTASISQRDLAVRGLTAADKVYDATRNASVGGWTLSGVLSGDQVNVAAGAGSFADANVGQGKVVTAQASALGGSDAGNYRLASASATTSAAITPATLTYVATPATGFAGAPIPPLVGNVNGLIGGDTLGGATTGTVTFTTPAAATSPVGSYAVNGSGLSAQNYVFTQATGNATALDLLPPQVSVGQEQNAAVDNAIDALQATTRPEFHAQITQVGVAPSGRTLDAFPALVYTSSSQTAQTAPTFRSLPVESMTQTELTTLLSARNSYKKSLFNTALKRLGNDPALSDVGACQSVEQIDSGTCLITDAIKRQIAATRATEDAKPPVPAGGAAPSASPVAPPPTPAAPAAAPPSPAVIARAAPTNEVVAGTLTRKRPSSRAALPQIQRKYAVLIGTDLYADTRIPKLDNAVGDARAVGQLLETTLGYETIRIENGSKATIIRTLNRLAADVGANDSVIIYYAGHGELVAETGQGYWMPATSEANRPESWLSNADIGRLLAQIGASQVALISDSCYSGSLVSNERIRTSNALDPQQVLARKTVVVMSSGGNEPVFDQGKDGHSPFAYSLMRNLQQVSAWQPGGNVFERVRFAVAKELPQRPQYGASPQGGHQAGGDYLFEQRQLGAAQ